MPVCDDVALLATTREAAETAINAYQAVAKSLGLTVSLPKTKYMVVGYNILQEEMQTIKVEGSEIECVEDFSI